MTQVTIYTSPFCGYSHAAKRLLTAKGMPFDEIDVSADTARRAEMRERAGGRTTVPQVFVGDVHVGGSDELHALERSGRLDSLLEEAA